MTVFLAHTVSSSPQRVLAVVLLAAALVYVGFSVSARAGGALISVELIGVALFGALAWAGTRFCLWWLVAGWAFHAVWDAGLHLNGPAANAAPGWYAHLCFSFDLVVAGYLALQTLRRRTDSALKATPLRDAA